MAKWIANALAYVFHPVFYPPLLLLFYLYSNPIDFGLNAPLDDMILVFQTVITCTVLPVVAIIMMRKLNIISSLHMDDRMERIGPYIVMMIFLIWYYLSVDLYGVAPVFRSFILGGLLSLFAVFIINLFMKVSLHAMGISGLISSLMISYLNFDYRYFVFRWGDQYLQLDYSIIFIIVFLILFIVLLSRFYLRKHTISELLGGLLLGLFGQVIALKLIYFI